MSRSFDGVDDLINCQSDSSLDQLDAVTVVLWMNLISEGSLDVGRLVAKRTIGGDDGWWNVTINGSGADSRRIELGADFVTVDLVRRSNDDIFSFNVWERVFVTWDGSGTAANIHIYVNGNEVTYAITTDGTGGREDDSTQNLYLGNDGNAGRTTDGKLAHIQLWNRVLQLNEMNQASRFPGSIRRELRGYWPLFGQASPEPDLSGNGNNGAITGAIFGATNPPI